jgi:stage III sporulation protein AA
MPATAGIFIATTCIITPRLTRSFFLGPVRKERGGNALSFIKMVIKQYLYKYKGGEPMSLNTAANSQLAFMYLASTLREILDRLSPALIGHLEEIRIRQGRPLAIRTGQRDCFIDRRGQAVDMPGEAYQVTGDDVRKTVQLISQGSLYAFEEEFRQGFLTIPGGHRVGLAGKAVLDAGSLKTLRDIGSLCFRIARAIPGAAQHILPYLIDHREGWPYHTLIVSPPRAGKTTVLRDLVRLLSCGVPELGLAGSSVGVVDERGEIAACYGGVPQHDLGPRVDVLDHCPKAVGMQMLLRSLSPQVIATDEIGRREDMDAVWEMVYTGVSVLTTVHASRFEELEQRPYLRELVAEGVFQRYVFLSRRRGPGPVEGVWDGHKHDVRNVRAVR